MAMAAASPRAGRDTRMSPVPTLADCSYLWREVGTLKTPPVLRLVPTVPTVPTFSRVYRGEVCLHSFRNMREGVCVKVLGIGRNVGTVGTLPKVATVSMTYTRSSVPTSRLKVVTGGEV